MTVQERRTQEDIEGDKEIWEMMWAGDEGKRVGWSDIWQSREKHT